MPVPNVRRDSHARRWTHLLPFASVLCVGLLCVACAPNLDKPTTTASPGPTPVPSPYTAAECIRDANCDEIMVAAHRGHFAEHPENSLAAIRAAAALGAEVIEIDVRHSKDERLFLMHDVDVNRTTDGEGDIAAMAAGEIAQLTLNGGDPANIETTKVPLFSEALALARELDVMLYVDEKTDRNDLVRSEVVDSTALEHVLIRTDLNASLEHVNAVPQIIVMPHVPDLAALDAALEAIPDLLIVEADGAGLVPELYETAKEFGIKVQQDLFIADIAGAGGDYSAWKQYVDAGVFLLQTNFTELLVPAIWQYRESGTFPTEGPTADR